MAVKKPTYKKMPKKPAKGDTPTQKLRYLEKVKEVKKANAKLKSDYDAAIKAEKKLNEAVEKAYKDSKK